MKTILESIPFRLTLGRTARRIAGVSNAGVAPPEGRYPTDERAQLAEFVGRLYLFLTVVSRPLEVARERMRPLYKSALVEVYPSVRELQLVLLASPPEAQQRLLESEDSAASSP